MTVTAMSVLTCMAVRVVGWASLHQTLARSHNFLSSEASWWGRAVKVELTYPDGQPVWAQLEGHQGGQEHRFFDKSHRATAIFWRHSTRTPKMTATAPATKNGIVKRSIRHTQNIADSFVGKKKFTESAASISGTPMM